MISEDRLKTLFDIWSERSQRTSCSITGNCMSPVIREGDSMIMEHGNRDIRIGDVVVYRTPDKFYTHRVLGIERKSGKELFLLKGDRSPCFDKSVPRDMILGKVMEVRGSNGCIHFDSVFWEYLNYVLAIRSYIAGRCFSADSFFWKAMRIFLSLRSKMLPRSHPFGSLLWRLTCRAYRVWFGIERFLDKKREV
jgi:signal peptidase I